MALQRGVFLNVFFLSKVGFNIVGDRSWLIDESGLYRLVELLVFFFFLFFFLAVGQDEWMRLD